MAGFVLIGIGLHAPIPEALASMCLDVDTHLFMMFALIRSLLDPTPP